MVNQSKFEIYSIFKIFGFVYDSGLKDSLNQSQNNTKTNWIWNKNKNEFLWFGPESLKNGVL